MVQTEPVGPERDVAVEDGLGGAVDEQTEKVGASMRL